MVTITIDRTFWNPCIIGLGAFIFGRMDIFLILLKRQGFYLSDCEKNKLKHHGGAELEAFL